MTVGSIPDLVQTPTPIMYSNVQKDGPGLRELDPKVRGGQDVESRNLGPPFLRIPVDLTCEE